jgi:hypothetical protein
MRAVVPVIASPVFDDPHSAVPSDNGHRDVREDPEGVLRSQLLTTP